MGRSSLTPALFFAASAFFVKVKSRSISANIAIILDCMEPSSCQLPLTA